MLFLLWWSCLFWIVLFVVCCGCCLLCSLCVAFFVRLPFLCLIWRVFVCCLLFAGWLPIVWFRFQATSQEVSSEKTPVRQEVWHLAYTLDEHASPRCVQRRIDSPDPEQLPPQLGHRELERHGGTIGRFGIEPRFVGWCSSSGLPLFNFWQLEGGHTPQYTLRTKGALVFPSKST